MNFTDDLICTEQVLSESVLGMLHDVVEYPFGSRETGFSGHVFSDSKSLIPKSYHQIFNSFCSQGMESLQGLTFCIPQF